VAVLAEAVSGFALRKPTHTAIRGYALRREVSPKSNVHKQRYRHGRRTGSFSDPGSARPLIGLLRRAILKAID
jgi:hypothetical protein